MTDNDPFDPGKRRQRWLLHRAHRLPSASKLLGLTLVAFTLTFLFIMINPFASHPPLPKEESVDVDRFMGDWYVHGHVPVFGDDEAHNAVESYKKGEGNKVLVTYAFRDGGFDRKLEIMEPTGFVHEDSRGEEWGMRFIWPFKADYVISYLDDDYRETIVARPQRDYAWIMTRDRSISDESYRALSERLAGLGYELEKLRRVPQRWPDESHPASRRGDSMAAEMNSSSD